MLTNADSLTRTVRDKATLSEWKARVQLAACYRLMAHFGWGEIIYNHASARVPDTADQFLLNPFGYAFEEVTASSLVKVNLDGDIVDPTPYKIHKGGFVIHSAVYGARPDVTSVVHLHTRAGMAVSMMKRGLLPLSQTAMFFYGRVGYHESEGFAVDGLSERERIAADLADNIALILRNHGTLVAGASVPEAFVMMYKLEKAMEAQIDALASGEELTYGSPELAASIARFGFTGKVLEDPELAEYVALEHNGLVSPTGWMEWPALTRLADRLDPSYKY